MRFGNLKNLYMFSNLLVLSSMKFQPFAKMVISAFHLPCVWFAFYSHEFYVQRVVFYKILTFTNHQDMKVFKTVYKKISWFCLVSIQIMGVFMSTVHLHAAQNLSSQTHQQVSKREVIAEGQKFLKTLPEGYLPYAEFSQKFNLNAATTEKSNPITSQLSQTMSRDPIAALRLLLEADNQVLVGVEQFLPVIATYAPIFAKHMQQGGRIFFVGAGASSRVGLDITAKSAACFPNFKDKVQAIMAGGETVLIRSKEGFEDSEIEGEKALKHHKIGQHDIVILISASGSSSFNVGCGNFAANQGANVFYFFNNKNIPERTQALFKRSSNQVIPLELDIGPQAIKGSTRLQAATLAQACLGSLVASSIYYCQGDNALAENFAAQLLANMKIGISLTEKNLESIFQFVKMETLVFSNPQANFRKLKDESNEGYVTFVALADSLREVLVDSVEMVPTFSTSYMRKEGERTKRAEFSSFLIGQDDNSKAWTTVLGKEVNSCDPACVQSYILAMGAEGENSYRNRPTGKGNAVVAALKLPSFKDVPQEIIHTLKEAQARGAETGIILLTNYTLQENTKKALHDLCPCMLVLENTPQDAFGYSESIVLKQVLNLISNGVMLSLHKVHGNQMIDLRASNMKLVNRSMALIQDIWTEYGLSPELNPEELYHFVCHVSALKNAFEEQNNVQTPSLVKIVLTMLFKEKTPEKVSFEAAVKLLNDNNDDLDLILSSGTICIDGGGSKTLLQVIDRKGNLLPLFQNGAAVNGVRVNGSNINTVGVDGVRAALHALFDGVQIGQRKQNITNVFSNYKIVAGMTGVKLLPSREKVMAIFEEFGIRKEKIWLLPDCDVVLNLLPAKGIVLIDGAGSSCFAKDKKREDYRVGGLGAILGDEGSGHSISLQALKKGLADEMGWGKKTSLTTSLKSVFNVNELKALIPKVNSREIPPGQIAKAAPIVFEAAENGDQVAQAIVNKAAKDLHKILVDMIRISDLSDCELHLWGGIFRNKNAKAFIEKMDGGLFKKRAIRVINRAHQNPTLELAKASCH
jgi:N-acetylmuramic acid 6-phosphate (MurNAc-6-P) etherase/N-acetylglucosamine kinase-like BadF-type ATPase